MKIVNRTIATCYVKKSFGAAGRVVSVNRIHCFASANKSNFFACSCWKNFFHSGKTLWH